MKLETYRIAAPAVTGYGTGWIAVDGVRVEASVVVRSTGATAAWGCERFEGLTQAHFALLAEGPPDVVVFGSGERMRFPSAALLRPLVERRIGVEVMDNAAACRTYNILAGEGRRVVAAILLERRLAARVGA